MGIDKNSTISCFIFFPCGPPEIWSIQIPVDSSQLGDWDWVCVMETFKSFVISGGP